MAAGPQRTLLPLIPLAPEAVLLPGLTLRIPVRERPDIAALLSTVYTRTASESPKASNAPSNIPIGCVPRCSPLLSPEGELQAETADARLRKTAERLARKQHRAAQTTVKLGPVNRHDNKNSKVADQQELEPADIFAYGVVAKIVGVQGRKTDDLALIVEGEQRFRVERFTQFKPFVECEATPLGDEVVDPADADTQVSFRELKQLAREFLTLIRLASLLPDASAPLSPGLARRLGLFVAQKDLEDAGPLADFMTNVVAATFEEKLQVLAALDIRLRLERTSAILKRQINSIKGNVRITSFNITDPRALPPGLDIHQLPLEQKDAISRRDAKTLTLGGSSLPGGSPGFGNNGAGDMDEEISEFDELKQRLDQAGLSPEARKVADKDMARLRRMNPAQAEYGVCRNYLETLLEVPWTKVSEDQLDRDTLARARKQLDDDHYGLEKIKKRLLEHLAVLRLKQIVNEAATTASTSPTSSVKSPSQALVLRDESQDPRSAPLPPLSSESTLSRAATLKTADKSPILLLVGPPGTGKTSLAKSIATALGRHFHRISLGGVRDEAEIRGHRRTYVAAMPGLIVNGLKKVGVANPVFSLDEIDKVGGPNFHGDPSAALLEVLDPEQNHTFVDHYLQIPLDLSRVLFIATANTLDIIPAPLLDRMEAIQLVGYTATEKRHIASSHLLPKQIRTNGLEPSALQLSPDVLETIIASYTREAGVRNLEREIGAICRAKAVQFSEACDQRTEMQAPSSHSSGRQSNSVASLPNLPPSYRPNVTVADLDGILGAPRFEPELTEASHVPGIVTGLVAFSGGSEGSILFIEIASMPAESSLSHYTPSGSNSSPTNDPDTSIPTSNPSLERVHLTGTLGAVLRESVDVALSWVLAHAFALHLTPTPQHSLLSNRRLHVHCPAGATPKDGPSAGLAVTIALVSLFAQQAVPADLALTGEVSLRGKVLPVGGIVAKLIGARRAGVRRVLLPKRNVRDLRDVPDEVREGLTITPVEWIGEALRVVWPDRDWAGTEVVESRL